MMHHLDGHMSPKESIDIEQGLNGPSSRHTMQRRSRKGHLLVLFSRVLVHEPVMVGVFPVAMYTYNDFSRQSDALSDMQVEHWCLFPARGRADLVAN